MLHSSPVIFGAALFSSLRLVSAEVGLGYTISDLSTSCQKIETLVDEEDIYYNATSSFRRPAFLNSTTEWTWHTSLITDKTNNRKDAAQLFWVDTTGTVDLNAPNLPFKSCVQFRMIPDMALHDPQKDNGDCESTLGTKCVDAMRAALMKEGVNPTGDCHDVWEGLSPMPDECKKEGESGSWSGMAQEYTRRNCTAENDVSTFNNPTGQRSVDRYVLPNANSTGGFEVYDDLAKKNYLQVAVSASTQSDAMAPGPEIQFTCFRNVDFAEGSRNPFTVEQPKQPEGPQQPPQPTETPSGNQNSGEKNMANVAGLVAALFVGMSVL